MFPVKLLLLIYKSEYEDIIAFGSEVHNAFDILCVIVKLDSNINVFSIFAFDYHEHIFVIFLDSVS